MFKRSLLSALCLVMLTAIAATPAWTAGLNDVIRTLETPFQADTDAKYRISDYSADFFQESKIASLDRLQRASGRVEVAFDYKTRHMGRAAVPTVKFRWEYEQPTTQEIVSNGETMWVYLPENNQVIQSDIEMVNKANQNDPMTFLTGLGNLSRDFTISWGIPNQDIDGNYVLELSPRRVSSLINKLIIVVDRFAVEAYQNRGNTAIPEDPMMAPPSMSIPSAPPHIPGSDFPFPGVDDGAHDIWFPILSTAVYDPNGNSTIIEFNDVAVNIGISDMSFDFMMPAGVQVVRPTGKEMGY